MSLREAPGDSGGVLSATADVLSAFLSIAVVVGLPLSIGNELLGSPLSSTTVPQVVFVVSLGGAYPVVAGDWPLAKLTDFALAAILTWFALAAFVSFGLLAAADGGLPSDSPVSTAVRFAVVAVSFGVAALYVRRRSHAARAGDDADSH